VSEPPAPAEPAPGTTTGATTDVASDRPAGRRRLAPLVAGAVAVVLVGLFVVLLTADVSQGESADSPLLGKVAPDVAAEYDDGSPFVLSHRKGSWVVLNFFTHDCIPCIREHPQLVEFVDQQEALGAEGAEFYSVVRDSTRSEVDDFFAERGGDWPIVYDVDYEFVNGFGVPLVPETWIVDPNGVVRARFISEVTAADLSAALQSMRELS
jgi:cytochrome c biogenesis protein CcmG/thiol:disulfide interchange protein DsbE